ncbi:MAG TPA: hypothetical protein G4O00_08390 [Thermoflexia bacterium]|jgi:steroid 5-alpha reductase family enzyme|nr:hypothetical protein [Thermoflexia bacterium]
MRRSIVFLALVLIAVGCYFLLVQLRLGIPTVDQIWPAFPLVWGITSLITYFRSDRKAESRVFWGTALVLSSLFLFLISMGDQDYSVLRTWWPVFVAIVGIAFLALWLAQGLRDWEILFLAIFGLIFGGGALVVNLQLLGPNTAEELSRLWPALLILVGALLLLREFRREK